MGSLPDGQGPLSTIGLMQGIQGSCRMYRKSSPCPAIHRIGEHGTIRRKLPIGYDTYKTVLKSLPINSPYNRNISYIQSTSTIPSVGVSIASKSVLCRTGRRSIPLHESMTYAALAPAERKT